MAKDRKKLIHIHSSIPDKQPTPQSLEVGEIAVNNAANQEFLSIKNSEDKVKRFSSDEQLITWMEKKEVMPYEGQVRGEVGPTGTKDDKGSYGITNDDLLQNKSNIIIKLNQVAASATTKHNVVNGAKDIYENFVNPAISGGVIDGAGFAIDMSRYAMIGANPSFSSITVTDKSDLSGNTTIANGDRTGTRTGHTLAIKTTDVTANDTNWTETITNRTSTVTNETNKITTLNESATTRTTVVGTENLTVSGATTENKTGNVIENNLSDKTESTAGVLTENNNSNHIVNTIGTTNITRTGVVTEDNKNNVTRTTSGSTTETFKGQVTENNQSGYTVNTTGNVIVNTTGTTTETKAGNVTENNLASKTENTTGAHSLYSTGNTCINSQANANFYGKVNTNIGVACDGTTKGSATTVVGTTTLNMSGATTTISGNTTNVTGATTLNLSGNTTNKRALTANTTSTSAYTSATTATTVIGTANTSATTATLSGNTLDITEATRLSAKTPSTYVSGTSLNIVEANTDIESCGRISGKTNAFTIQECATGSGKTVINQTDIKASGKTLSFDETTSISAKTPSTTLSGTNLAVNETTSTINSTNTNLTGTNLSISETNTTINSCGKIEVTTDKYTLKQCSTSGGSAEFEFCNGYTVRSNAINLQQCGTAGTINITSQTQNINGGNLTVNESGNTAINVGGNLTENVTGTTTNTHTGAVTENNNDGYTVNTTGDTCLQSTADVNVGGAANTNIGTNCDDSVKANYVNIKAKSGITETANTVTISGTTSASISGATVNVSGNTTNISGATNLNMSGKTVNVDATDIDVDASNNYCLSAATKANIYGKATNIGIECGGSISTATTIEGTTVGISGNTTNISGTSVNVSGGSITEISTGKACITAGSDLNIGGDANTNIGYNCAGTGIANNTNIFASTAVTINTPKTNITGDTYLSGKTYFNNTCETVDANELSDAFCEVLSRGVVSMDVTSNPAPGILKRYTIQQNGANISGTANGVIDVPKDFLLKSAAVVYGNASADRTSFTACTGTQTNCHWYIELVFNVKDGTSEESKLYLEEDDFIKDITDNNPSGVVADSSYNNVAVKVEYDGKKNVVSATTTPTIHAKENIYADGTVSGATVSGTTVKGATVSAGTLTVTGNTTLKGTTATTLSATSVSATTFYGKMSKDLSFSTGTTSVETPYNGSAAKSVTIASDVKHLYRNQLKVDYGSSVSSSNDFTYDPGAGTVNTSGNTRLDTITIPTSVKNLNNWNGSCYEFDAPLCVTGTITASGAIYSSDKNLKENINRISYEDLDKVALIEEKSFNFKDDDEKRKVYGVIAQDVQKAGLDELVHVKEDGMLGVDYTSFLILKVAKLTQDNNALTALVVNLDQRVRELENKLNNKD